MERFDEQLRRLDAQIQRMHVIRGELDGLEKQRMILESRVRELDGRRAKEREDVVRLDGVGLKNLYYRISGKMEEVRAQEQTEAQEVDAEYEMQRRALAEMNRRIDGLREEMSGLHGCEQQYRQVFADKTAAIYSSGSRAALRLRELDQTIAVLERQVEEIREAVQTGWEVKQTANRVLEKLDSADNWATWDLIGGGLIADLAKHSRMDEAQSLMIKLQRDIERFQSEVADVKISLDAQLNIEGFLRFADYFFDGLIADWAVKNKIARSKDQICRVTGEIGRMIHGLERMLKDSEGIREARIKERRNLILETI